MGDTHIDKQLNINLPQPEKPPEHPNGEKQWDSYGVDVERCPSVNVHNRLCCLRQWHEGPHMTNTGELWDKTAMEQAAFNEYIATVMGEPLRHVVARGIMPPIGPRNPLRDAWGTILGGECGSKYPPYVKPIGSDEPSGNPWQVGDPWPPPTTEAITKDMVDEAEATYRFVKMGCIPIGLLLIALLGMTVAWWMERTKRVDLQGTVEAQYKTIERLILEKEELKQRAIPKPEERNLLMDEEHKGWEKVGADPPPYEIWLWRVDPVTGKRSREWKTVGQGMKLKLPDGQIEMEMNVTDGVITFSNYRAQRGDVITVGGPDNIIRIEYAPPLAPVQNEETHPPAAKDKEAEEEVAPETPDR